MILFRRRRGGSGVKVKGRETTPAQKEGFIKRPARPGKVEHAKTGMKRHNIFGS